MKKLFCLLLAVLMIVPMFVSCGNSGSGVEYLNVKVYRYNDKTATTTTEFFNSSLTVTVEEGAEVTLKDVVLSFDPAAYYNEGTSRFDKISEFSADAEWFWNYTVNGEAANLATVVKPEDAIEIIYEPLNKEEAPAATAEAAA